MQAEPAASKCPLCKASTVHEFRPFCSKGCRDRDLIGWIDEGYRIPAQSTVPPFTSGTNTTVRPSLRPRATSTSLSLATRRFWPVTTSSMRLTRRGRKRWPIRRRARWDPRWWA